MNILVSGATGFIASQIVTDLLAAGNHVTCCVRDTAYAKRIFPTATVIACDFVNDTDEAVWLPRLVDIDIVINCAGILYHPREKIIWAIHHDTPRALFNACLKSKVRQIMQISALGIEHIDLAYAKSKKAVDDYLLTLPIQSIVIRPSLVYGPGSYGGTSLLRGLSGLPGIIPLPGKGTEEFQPIHIEDLAKAILQLLDRPSESQVLYAAGPTTLPLRSLLSTYRAWLGFTKARFIDVPLTFMRLLTRIGDWFPYSTLNTTAYKMLLQNNVTSADETRKFQRAVGFIPRDFATGLFSKPSSVQDRWHARLYFLKPLLRFSIALIWILSGICGGFISKGTSLALLAQAGVATTWQPALLYGASAIDILIGITLLAGFQLRRVCYLQLLLIFIYTALISWKLPYLWVDPFTPIAKNIPLFVAVLILLAMESDR